MIKPFHLLLLLPALAFSQINTAKKIWIDTDNRMGKVKGDVDDGLALMLALADSTVEIRGISTVRSTHHANKVTRKLLKWYGREVEVPVYNGAKSHESEVETEAVKALANALMKEKLTIVALGPATNVASLLRLHPEVIPRVEEIIFCMGRTPGVRFNTGSGKREFRDYNFELDPEAMRLILKTNVRISFVGYEAASSIYLDRNDDQTFRNNGRAGDQWVYRQLKAWNWKWRVFLKSKKGFIPFDAVTVGYVLQTGSFRCENEIPVAIESLDGKAGKPSLFISRNIKPERNVNYCSGVQASFKDFLMGRLLGK